MAVKANRSAVALDTLDASETAYFESGGNEAPEPAAPVVAAAPAPVVAPKVEAPAPAAKKEAVAAPAAKVDAVAPAVAPKVEAAPAVAKVEASQPEARTVPLPDLIEERKRRQALEEQVTTANARIAKLAELMTPKPAEVQPAQPVDFLADPQAHVKGLGEEINVLRDFKRSIEQERANQAALQAVMNPAAIAEREFQATHPDYNAAANHLVSHARQELKLMGLNDVQIDGTIAQQGLLIAQMAQQQGKNPAEIIYERAKLRGYKSPEPALPAVAAAPVTQLAAAAASQAETEDQRIARIQRGQDANVSLSQASGGAQPVIDAQALANMSEADFTKVYARLENNPAALREFFGG